MSRRCEMGFHAFRHVSLEWLERMTDIVGEPQSWSHEERCKRCLIEQRSTVFKYPRIKTYAWESSRAEG